MTLTTSHLSLTVDTESGQQSLVKLRLTEVLTAFDTKFLHQKNIELGLL